jgi:GAF domain-containing protein
MKRKYSPIDEIKIQLTLADTISRLVIQSSSTQEVARKTVVELAELMPVDRATLALIDHPAQKVQLLALISDGGLGRDTTIPLSDTPFAWVAENKQALLEQGLKREKRFPSEPGIPGEGIRTLVHMPLFYQGEVYGVLTTGSYQPNAYQDSQLRFLRHAATHLAISLKSSLLLEQNLKTEKSLTDLNELLGIITSSPELPNVFPRFAQRLKKVIPFD